MRPFVFFGLTVLLPLLLSFCKDSKEKKINAALEKGREFLTGIQREDGAICDTVNPLIESWETALAATALYESRRDTNEPVLKKALFYLRANEDGAGLICNNRKCRDAYCLETTAVYFSLMLETGEKEKVRARLDTVISLQKSSGEWELGSPDVREQKDFPSVTAFVLNMLNDAGMEARFPGEAWNFLKSKQTPEGHWGSAWEYYGCPAYALWPVTQTLNRLNANDKSNPLEKATSYIRSSQQKNGSWDSGSSSYGKKPSAELQTALMLSNLKYSEINRETIDKGINFLLSHQQKNGSWDGGYFPIPSDQYVKQEYVFATSLAMRVLNRYLHDLTKTE